MAVPTTWVLTFALALYGVLLVFNLYLLVVPVYLKLENLLSIPGFYQIFIVIFLIVRILWFLLVTEDSSAEITTFILSRLSFCLFFTALSLILFSWIQVLSSEFTMQRGFLPGLFVVFCFVNVFLYLLSLISVAAFVSTTDPSDHTSRFYFINIILLAVVNFIASCVFLVFGVKLYRRIHQNSALKQAATRVVIVAGVIVVCFLLRMVTFSWHPITGLYFTDDVFYPLSYFVAEGVPLIIQTFLYFRRNSTLWSVKSIRGREPTLLSSSALDTEDAHTLAQYKRDKHRQEKQYQGGKINKNTLHTKDGLLMQLYPHENGGVGESDHEDDRDSVMSGMSPISSPVNRNLEHKEELKPSNGSYQSDSQQLQTISNAGLIDPLNNDTGRSFSGLNRSHDRPSHLGSSDPTHGSRKGGMHSSASTGSNRDRTATTASNTAKGALTFWKSSADKDREREQQQQQENKQLEHVTLMYSRTIQSPSTTKPLSTLSLDIDSDGHFDRDHDDDQSQTPYSPLSS